MLPNVLSKIAGIEKPLIPNSVGIYPPIVPPTNIPIKMRDFVFMEIL